MWVFTLDMVKKSKKTGKERQEWSFAAIYEGWTRRVNGARGAEKMPSPRPCEAGKVVD